MVIYFDVLLAVNWVIDFLLLHAEARLLRIPRRGWRLVLGSAAGAACCAVVLLPDLPAWASVAIKAGMALGMVAIAFGRRQLWRRTAVLFVLSAAVAGVAMAVWWLAAPQGLTVVNGVVYCDIPPLLLIALTGAAYAAMCLFTRLTRARSMPGGEWTLTVERGGRTACLRALYDTGNELAEPFSGAPVAVADYAALAGLVDAAWREGLPPGARAVPFSSVGGSGFLPAFRPDRLTLCRNGREWDVTGAFVAVSAQPLTGEYGALIGPHLTTNVQLSDRKEWSPT